MRLGTSTYSFWHFTPEKVPIEIVLRHARAMDLDGVEILHQQIESEEPAYVNCLKREALRLGLDLYCLSIHQDFVWPDAAQRREHVAHTLRCIDLAHELGAPCIRLNSGRWGTAGSFDALMAARGIETPLPGCTDEDAFDWCIGCIEECLPRAEAMGVVLGLENHWGLTFRLEGMERIFSALDSPWLAAILDTGNFLEDPYPLLERLAPRAIVVHAKTYFGGGEWYTLELDYRRIAAILAGVGFQGYVSIEMEGREDPLTAMPKSVAWLRECFSGPHAAP
ncbi:MAG: sugar phosphate isomerase/epimerase [Armatimonadetes bacterium]|nr:sugar phosphate isomerase/epimerase [Armatimonadota bacterium]